MSRMTFGSEILARPIIARNMRARKDEFRAFICITEHEARMFPLSWLPVNACCENSSWWSSKTGPKLVDLIIPYPHNQAVLEVVTDPALFRNSVFKNCNVLLESSDMSRFELPEDIRSEVSLVEVNDDDDVSSDGEVWEEDGQGLAANGVGVVEHPVALDGDEDSEGPEAAAGGPGGADHGGGDSPLVSTVENTLILIVVILLYLVWG
jgi:hypothetical protein